MHYKTCIMCDKLFKPHRRDARFCSTACKQKAYRRRADPEVGSIHREKQRQTNIAITKQERVKTLTCAVCGATIRCSVLHTNLIYCSAACKQKAYRQRKAEAAERSRDKYLSWKLGRISGHTTYED